MKRDMNLVREILFAIEASDDNPLGWVELNIEGRGKREIAYHVMLMHQAGLIKAMDVSTMGEDGFNWQAQHILWRGHEFLDAARNDSVWKKAMSVVAEKTGGASLDLLFDVLTGVAKEQFGLGG